MPAVDPYVPAKQLVHAATPAVDPYVPAAHWVQVADVIMPVPVENVPARQVVQERLAFARQAPYDPAEHGGHCMMIMGAYVSPRKAYRAATSLEDKAFV